MSSRSADQRVQLEQLRELARRGAGRDIATRLERLGALRSAVLDHEAQLIGALRADLGKSAAEALVTEIGLVVREIDYVRRNLVRWTRPEKMRVPLVQQPGRALARLEPLGLVLVVSPWNYPVYLALMPVISALAAGNCVVVKPSERAPATSAALVSLLNNTAAGGAVAAFAGGADLVHELIGSGVDHVFFTGSARVGSAVAEAAARQLVPVTLELGGKCPAYVDALADVDVAASRIAWAKFVNAGQTCVAPDYVLVHRDVADRFVAALCGAVTSMYGSHPRDSPDYARIIDAHHLARLEGLLEGHGGVLVLGGDVDRSDRYLAPTVVRDPEPGSRLMVEEIFGPVLAMVAVRDADEARAIVAAKPAPLAVYVFTEDRATRAAFEAGTRSGSFCVNAAMTQLAIDGLPFGGVGGSGWGVAHGRAGIETLSQRRAVLVRPARPGLTLHQPPYSAVKTWLVRRALGLPSKRSGGSDPRDR